MGAGSARALERILLCDGALFVEAGEPIYYFGSRGSVAGSCSLDRWPSFSDHGGSAERSRIHTNIPAAGPRVALRGRARAHG
jgi:hypothetical protein